MISKMPSNIHLLGLYLHLAQASKKRQRPFVRDRLLLLAGVTAVTAGLSTIAACCRDEILQNNPQHMIRRWVSMEDALADLNFRQLVQQNLRRYPLEKAEQMLSSLGIDMSHESESYYSEYEYAAALLGTTPDILDARFSGNTS